MKKTVTPTTKKAEPVKPPAPPPYVPQTPITEEAKRVLYQEALDHWAEQTDHYGYDLDRPDNVTAKMQAILGAVDAETARAALTKAKNTMQIMILSAWAKGKIAGPTNSRTVEKRIKKAENLAQMLEAKGLVDQAESQWARARELRGQLKDLRREESAG